LNRDGTMENIQIAKANAENDKTRRDKQQVEKTRMDAAEGITTGMTGLKSLEKRQHEALEITHGLFEDLEENARPNTKVSKCRCCTIV